MWLGLEARASKYQDSGSKFQVSTCGSGVREQKRDRDLLSRDHSKVPASGFKDPDLGWVPVVCVKTGVQKLGLRVWPRESEKRCQGLGRVLEVSWPRVHHYGVRVWGLEDP